MLRARSILIGTLGAAFVAGSVMAQEKLDPAVAARHAHMDLYAYNLGIVGGMARGNAEYNAEAASAAASNLAALSKLNQMTYWREGTSNFDLAYSRAKPELWDNLADAMAKSEALTAATETLASEAGNGLEALQAAVGPVGKACGACHEAYRVPDN